MRDAREGAPEACIVGWAHSPFGKLEDPDLESLMARVARAAIEDAGISPAEIDAGFVGIFGEGFTDQGFPSSLLLQSVPELRFIFDESGEGGMRLSRLIDAAVASDRSRDPDGADRDQE